MIALNWALRDHLHLLRDDGRLAVLMALSLHCDDQMRCFPSLDTLVRETGYSRPTVNKAKKWLIGRGAIALVPYEKREGDKEKELPVRSHVYKLTGFMRVESDEEYKKHHKSIAAYLVLSLDEVKGIRKFLKDTNNSFITANDIASFESKLSELSTPVKSKLSESSPSESSLTLPKGLSIGKGLSSVEGGVDARTPTQEEEPAPTPQAPAQQEQPKQKEADTTMELALYALMQAWCDHTDASVKFNNIYRHKNYLQAAEKLLDMGVTTQEVIDCTKQQVPKSRSTAYLFWYLVKDIPVWREQNKEKVQQQKLDVAGANTLAKQRAAMAEIAALKQEELAQQEVEEDGAA